jgi:hypothetical protein
MEIIRKRPTASFWINSHFPTNNRVHEKADPRENRVRIKAGRTQLYPLLLTVVL